ncbi:biotin/lipoate A/B protein ligase family protein [Desulfosporosinus sp. FKB]|uniref:lipoate--protein ligase family protein n=1 Tax=Desulfosporosinus sp. FKB TaxID=1969835 RepID=UPI000B4A167B|nr:biotin/lipoate A/B protein ligase family protein [Desulfosporosinus sp. FKB]
MDLYDLGEVSWWESQCYYHALAYLGREGLILCYPSSPYVCLGLHDDLDQEIDLEYCQRQRIPLFRRETGGGVVYLDKGQVFFQLVLRQDNSCLPLRRTRYYEQFLQPAISAYKYFGLPAKLKPPADLNAAGRKCSGNACGDIGKCTAYVGNLLVDFDYTVMSKILKVPGSQFRQYLRQTMQANMTTLKDWVNHSVGYDDLAALLVEGFKRQWGNLEARTLDDELIRKAKEIYVKTSNPEWIALPGRKHTERTIKIAEDILLLERRTGPDSSTAILLHNGKVEQMRFFGKAACFFSRADSLIGCEWHEDLLGRP